MSLVQTTRDAVCNLENTIKSEILAGNMESAEDEFLLNHHFTEESEEFGCFTYAREMFLPKGTVVVGKIHKHDHVNVISLGRVIVVTEFGKREYKAPITFISEVGLKRAVYVLEDTVWTTVHLTKNAGEDNLDKIEKEVIADSYTALDEQTNKRIK